MSSMVLAEPLVFIILVSQMRSPVFTNSPIDSAELPGLDEAPWSYSGSLLNEATGLHQAPFLVELPSLS